MCFAFSNFCLLCRFTFTNDNNVTVRVINFGATVTDILLPDKNGKIDDVSLGFDSVKGMKYILVYSCGVYLIWARTNGLEHQCLLAFHCHSDVAPSLSLPVKHCRSDVAISLIFAAVLLQ